MATADQQQRHQNGNGEIQTRQKLPGAKILIAPVPQWYDGPPFPHVVLSDMPIYVHYERVDESGGEWPPAPVSYGPRRVAGKGVRSFLGSSLWGLIASEATVTDDGVIRYRQSPSHSVRRFEPDPAAGVLIHDPEGQVTAPGYRITSPDGESYLWSRHAMLGAVEVCLREGPIDWPSGWAHLMPGGGIRFARGGFPWSGPQEWTAEPVAEPGDFGTPCADCGRYQTDHTHYVWQGYRRDKTKCGTWTAEPTR
ncbi:hypothetical protein [Streptomyces rubradiris]|uniref:Uncharacterized protein n=1 Tax=Streptomyces rubradiris TaxID=285531 RepID=A0ABQ3RAF5_STRRR|nr:hypothetical protein [Streptomyces rubradiris]GHH31453.1 hypothetical protein GCM10018792_79220 [Streptomyces rubradiris]GHI52840.1 hypothetical protein Srubr_26860 [Streptomyces rubradiris]